MRLARSFLTSTLLLASASATALGAHADDVQNSGLDRVITLTRTNYHTVCPCTSALLSSATTTTLLESKPGQSGESTKASSDGSSDDSSSRSSSDSNSHSDSSSGFGQQYTTSTVFTSHVHTMTACPSSVKDCLSAEKTTYVTTETVIDYTTICPVTESDLRTGAATKTGGIGSAQTLTIAGGNQFTTSTVYTTRVSTVTACPSSVKDCPASQRTTYVTTDTIIDYTTVCPVTATAAGSGARPTSTAPGSTGHGSGSGSVSISQSSHSHGSSLVSSSGMAHSSSPHSLPTVSHTGTVSASGSVVPSTIAYSNSQRPYSSSNLGTSASGTLISPSGSVQRTSSTPVIKSSTSVSASTSASASATLEPLALYVEPVQLKRKRQTYNTAVLIGAGTLTASCANADRFYLTGGHLYDGNLLVAANNNTSSAFFKGTQSPGPIRSTFTVTENILSWSSPNFSNGAASFCVSGNSVLSVFSGDMPSGCAPVTIAAVKYCTYMFVPTEKT